MHIVITSVDNFLMALMLPSGRFFLEALNVSDSEQWGACSKPPLQVMFRSQPWLGIYLVGFLRQWPKFYNAMVLVLKSRRSASIHKRHDRGACLCSLQVHYLFGSTFGQQVRITSGLHRCLQN